MIITYGSVCSGIEAASVAWHSLGFTAEWFSEIEAFPCAVLAHRWPEVPNLGDMTKIAKRVLVGAVAAPDILVGGTPCQAFSVAGMREGLADPRGALTIKYVELLDAIDHVRTQRGEPEAACLWENVPGVLSDKGNAFGCFLGALVGESEELQPPGGKWKDAGCVYGPRRTVAWRVLDAQYFGLAQRRRRVFVVASAREGFDPAAVLFEREGLRRDHPPRRGETEGATVGTLGGTSPGGGWRFGADEAAAGQLIPSVGVDVRNGCLTGDVAHTLQAGYHAPDPGGTPHVLSIHGTQDPDIRVEQAHTLGLNSGQENAIFAFHENQRAEVTTHDVACTLKVHGGKPGQGYPAAMVGTAVRRLIPRECERLQGFPDDYTLIPWRGKPAEECPDGPRYKAIGNSKAIPVVRWIGRRLLEQMS